MKNEEKPVEKPKPKTLSREKELEEAIKKHKRDKKSFCEKDKELWKMIQ